MSKEYFDCSRKKRFKDFNQALHRASFIRRSGGPLMDAYYCDFCGGYHLTKNREFYPQHKNIGKNKGYDK